MGFWNSIWDGIKSAGRGILNVGSKIGSGILNAGNWARNGINKVMGIVDKIPVVGGLVNRALDAPILDGVSLRQAAGIADSALDAGNSVRDGINAISRGDLSGVSSSGESAYNKLKDIREKIRESKLKRQQILAGRN